MGTQTTINAKLMDLPLMKNFDQSQIATKVDTFRKGEKNLFWFIKLGIMGAIGYGVWKYVLPQVFVMLGQMLALVATGVFLIFMVMAAPAIFAWLRILTREIHKRAIKFDPFQQLAIERQKMIANQTTFRIAKSNIASLRQEMEIEAKKSEDDANTSQTRIFSLQGKVEKIKNQMDNMVQKMGIDAKTEDEYVNLASEYQKLLAESQRVINKTSQSIDFKNKYEARSFIMKKMGQKLTMVETAMEIKIADFDATVEFLQTDYKFAQKSNQATSAAKEAMGFAPGWERDYALEVITNTIAADTAMTSSNLKDIESLTSNYNLDSDDLYANLNMIADKIKIGDMPVTSSKVYNNPDYKMTQSDRLNAGGFGDMF